MSSRQLRERSAYNTGTAHGDDIFEHSGFAVHFFDRALVDALADGWNLEDIHDFEEGELPRRLWRITQSRPADLAGQAPGTAVAPFGVPVLQCGQRL